VASLESAYRDVMRTDTNATRVLRLLGGRASATVTVADVAALIGKPAANATLDALADANLVVSPAPGRYLLPTLARLFATEWAKRGPRTW
jgi:hypothetical protein